MPLQNRLSSDQYKSPSIWQAMSQIEWEEERLIWLIHFSQSTTTMRGAPPLSAYEPSIIIFTLLLPSIPIASFHSVYSHLKSRGEKLKPYLFFFHFLNKSCCFWWWKKNLCPPTAVAVVLGDAVTDYGVIQSINPTRTVPTERARDFFRWICHNFHPLCL